MAEYRITLPLTDADVEKLRAGDSVLLSGEMLTGRDAAHKRLIALLDEGRELPVEIRGQTIYYVGPAPASPGHAVGSAGPTTSYRMDAYTPRLIEMGLKGMIGKGMRNEQVRRAMQQYGAVYFGAVGGAAALIAKSIRESRVLAYPDLGTEAIHLFRVEDFPVIVLMDAHGGNLYEQGPREFGEE
ncbi:MAG: Fe-S-containing hydro-lyase [Clostridia bacterium]|nr:Fe-S-containing hydro-lyase [Clostridia bacterium]